MNTAGQVCGRHEADSGDGGRHSGRHRRHQRTPGAGAATPLHHRIRLRGVPHLPAGRRDEGSRDTLT